MGDMCLCGHRYRWVGVGMVMCAVRCAATDIESRLQYHRLHPPPLTQRPTLDNTTTTPTPKKSYVDVQEEKDGEGPQLLALLESLEEDPDIQNVFHNARLV